jgi:hypothetical protein
MAKPCLADNQKDRETMQKFPKFATLFKISLALMLVTAVAVSAVRTEDAQAKPKMHAVRGKKKVKAKATFVPPIWACNETEASSRYMGSLGTTEACFYAGTVNYNGTPITLYWVIHERLHVGCNIWEAYYVDTWDGSVRQSPWGVARQAGKFNYNLTDKRQASMCFSYAVNWGKTLIGGWGQY